MRIYFHFQKDVTRATNLRYNPLVNSASSNSKKTHPRATSSSPRPSSSGMPAALSGLLELPKPAPVILIVSPDEVRKRRIVDLLLKKYSPAGQHELLRYDAGDLNLEQLARLLDSASALSLFSKQQFSLIRNLQDCPSAITKQLPKVLSRFGESHAAIFTSTEIPSNHPVVAFCKEKNSLVELEALKGFELHRWAERELKRLGFTSIAEAAISALVQAAEENLDEVAAMAEHLFLYCSEPSLNAADVEAVFIHRAIPGEFDFVDALVSGNTGRVEVMLSELLNAGKNPFMLLGLINRSITNYFGIASMLQEGQNQTDIRNKLGITPWAFNKQFPIAKRYRVEQLTRALRALVTLDSKLKNRSLGPETLIGEFADSLRIHQGLR